MDFHRSGRLGRAFSLLLIVVGGLAFWRLGVEVLWLGGVVLLEWALGNPRASLLVLVCLSALALVAYGGTPEGRVRVTIRHVLVILVSVATGVLLFQALAAVCIALFISRPGTYDWNRAAGPFLEPPFFGPVNLLLLGLVWSLVMRLQGRRVMRLAGRVVLFLGCVTAGMLSVEFLFIGTISVGVDGSMSLEAAAPLVGGTLLLVLCALGIKYVCKLQAPRWAVLLVTLATVLIVLTQNALQFLPIG